MQTPQGGCVARLADGGSPVAEADTFDRQAAQKRLARPFRRGGVVLVGGQRQGIRQALGHADAKFSRISCDCHVRELR
jgi:hypothetical protein